MLLIFLIASSGACEKDDICVEGDTPLLVIRFYNAADTTQLKTVSALRVIGLGQSSTVNTFTDRSNLDSIAIPLRVNEPDTGFAFILNSADDGDMETGNIDTLIFDYESRDVFISRACGFVANFENLTGTSPADSAPWVQEIVIVDPIVQNQTSAHVKIYH